MDQNLPLALSFDDVLIVPQYSEINSRSQVDISSQITPRIKLTLPLVSSNMTDVTEAEMAITLGKQGGLGILHRFCSPQSQAEMVAKVKESQNYAAAAVGCKEGFIERAQLLVKAGADMLLLDVAHGAMKQAIEATRLLRQTFKDQVDIMSGTVVTGETAAMLFEAGADCVKVGIGAGSICTTRIMTGSGMPQITAVLNCTKAARKYKKTIMSDGGIKNSGDVAKALAAGADCVCIGSLFAGTDEAPGQIIEINGQPFKEYKGSTAEKEKQKHLEVLKDVNEKYIQHIEGVAGVVQYKGPVSPILEAFAANLKSAFSYSGAWNLSEFHQKAKFVRITASGMRESQHHDVIVK